MDDALRCALQLTYCGDVSGEALQLLRENDHGRLLKASATHIRPPYTWARVADIAVVRIARALLDGDEDACEDARVLGDRLRDRDASGPARVTATLRHRIGQVVRLGACVEAVGDLRDGSWRADDQDALGKLLAARTAWFAVRREHASSTASDWLLDAVQRAAGRVLSSNASAGAKAMASRAVSAWTVEEKRPRGEVVSFDSDDEF
jgi:hypothetical protein